MTERIVLRTGEALVEGEKDYLCAEPEDIPLTRQKGDGDGTTTEGMSRHDPTLLARDG
jgi:hypothetical protein